MIAGEAATISELDLNDFPVDGRSCRMCLIPAKRTLSGGASSIPAEPGNILTQGLVERGNPDEAIRIVPHSVSGAIETSFVEHAYIEPEAGWAEMDGETLVIRACTQSPYMDRDDTAAVLGLKPENVRIVPTATGGGFGSKLDISVQPFIGLVALKTGRPAALVYTRAESMMSTTKRHPASMRATIGADANGRVTGMVFEGEFNTGPYASWGPTVATRVPVHACGPYLTPNYRAVGRAVHTNGPIAGAFRGFGVPQATIMQETLYDELAGKFGLDRLEFRRINVASERVRNRYRPLLEQGVGIGACLRCTWTPLGSRIERYRGLQSGKHRPQARGRRGFLLVRLWHHIAAEPLDDQARHFVGWGGGAASGRRRYGSGLEHRDHPDCRGRARPAAGQLSAERRRYKLLRRTPAKPPPRARLLFPERRRKSAAQSLREKILRFANVSRSSLRFEGKGLMIQEGDAVRHIDLSALDADRDGYVFGRRKAYDPPTAPLDAKGQGRPYAVYGYGAQIAELEVDMELGTVKLIKSRRRTTSAGRSTRSWRKARSRAASHKASAWH